MYFCYWNLDTGILNIHTAFRSWTTIVKRWIALPTPSTTVQEVLHLYNTWSILRNKAPWIECKLRLLLYFTSFSFTHDTVFPITWRCCGGGTMVEGRKVAPKGSLGRPETAISCLGEFPWRLITPNIRPIFTYTVISMTQVRDAIYWSRNFGISQFPILHRRHRALWIHGWLFVNIDKIKVKHD